MIEAKEIGYCFEPLSFGVVHYRNIINTKELTKKRTYDLLKIARFVLPEGSREEAEFWELNGREHGG